MGAKTMCPSPQRPEKFSRALLAPKLGVPECSQLVWVGGPGGGEGGDPGPTCPPPPAPVVKGPVSPRARPNDDSSANKSQKNHGGVGAFL